MYNNEERTEDKEITSQKDGRARKRKPKTHRVSKDQKVESRMDGKLDATGRDNDPNWYFLDAEIADQASSFALDSYVGVPTPFEFGANAERQSTNIMIPSILAVNINPCPGDTSSIQTGINMAALKLYTRLSSMNAKTTNYAPQDLTILLLGLGDIISTMEHIRRAFGVAFTYNVRNRDMPTKLLEAMGFQPDDFLQNLAQHRLAYNSLVTSINKLPFLSNISYLYKCADIFQNIYADSDSAMAQIMLMRPYSTWQVDDTSYEEGTILKTVTLPKLGTWDEWYKIVSNMIQAMFESITFNYIYSDILNLSARSGDKLLYMDYLREDYVVVPTYNANFSLQLHNSNAIGAPTGDTYGSSTPNNDVYPDVNKNMIKYVPIWKGTTPGEFDVLVDFPTASASVEDRIEATRYCSLLRYESSSSGTVLNKAVALPDHYVVNYTVFGPMKNYAKDPISKNFITLSAESVYFTLTTAILTQVFDWAPIFVCNQSFDGTNEAFIIGDVNYYTTLDTEWFKRVNDLTFQALFELR